MRKNRQVCTLPSYQKMVQIGECLGAELAKNEISIAQVYYRESLEQSPSYSNCSTTLITRTTWTQIQK